MNVSSFFPGRIRIRDEVLKDGEISAALRAAIENHEAIKNIDHNLRTGSVLIEYHVSKLPVEKLMTFQKELLELQKLCDRYNGSDKSAILLKIGELKEKLAL
ncbi:HMA2 domain-containing protein [Treponema sp.]|uniref:HMA2 domain-containing protein n=1 Tax=Treponema sp. TaxID=166 RepID=UPI0025E64B0C|nr:hypothetical protein [Treponema sp.]MCR5217466.1 hypothetical protein [Treponema sp.]